MAYSKAYQSINWQNKPSTKTPLNESNLNKMDTALNEIDDRIVSIDTKKFNANEAYTLLKNVSFNEKTGELTFTRYDGSTIKLSTSLAKVITNFYFNPITQEIEITLEDGTIQYVSLSDFLSLQEFEDSETIAFTNPTQIVSHKNIDLTTVVSKDNVAEIQFGRLIINDTSQEPGETTLWVRLPELLDPALTRLVRINFVVDSWDSRGYSVQVFAVPDTSTSTLYTRPISELILHNNDEGNGEGYVEFNTQQDYCGYLCLKSLPNKRIKGCSILSMSIDLLEPIENKLTAKVKEGSINEKHLRPDYLADIRVESAKAESSAKSAAQSAQEAKEVEEKLEGGIFIDEVELTNSVTEVLT